MSTFDRVIDFLKDHSAIIGLIICGVIGILVMNWVTSPVMDTIKAVDLFFLRFLEVCVVGLFMVAGYAIGDDI